MKLATLRDGTRDGELVVVARAGDRFARVRGIAPSLQALLDDWERLFPELERLSTALERGLVAVDALDPRELLPPLPRAYEWVDASAYLSHVVLVRKARGAEPPASIMTDPLVYQGGSGVLLAPTAPLKLPQSDVGLDFEGEVAVILGDTPEGVSRNDASRYVRLVTLVNDVTYRALVPAELEKGFGFFCSKPATAFAPFAVTPDELGPAYREGRVHLPLRSTLNEALVGEIDAGTPMHFSFFDLIEHITKTRAFTAGTILGGGTVSSVDTTHGVSCLAELRMREKLETGSAKTPFLKAGDRVHIEMIGLDGVSVFGAIDQEVVVS
jgi:fumarylacetoacetate (FAA) hydrolase